MGFTDPKIEDREGNSVCMCESQLENAVKEACNRFRKRNCHYYRNDTSLYNFANCIVQESSRTEA